MGLHSLQKVQSVWPTYRTCCSVANFYECGSKATYASAGIATAVTSVRLPPSAFLSVTLWCCIKTNMIFFTEDLQTLVFAKKHITCISKFDGVTSIEGVKWDWGMYELAIFYLLAAVSPKRCKY